MVDSNHGPLRAPLAAMMSYRALISCCCLLAACGTTSGDGAGPLDVDLPDYVEPAFVLSAGPADAVLSRTGDVETLREALSAAEGDERARAFYEAELTVLSGHFGEGLDAMAQLVVDNPSDTVALLALERLLGTRRPIARHGRRYAELAAALEGVRLPPGSADLVNELAIYGAEESHYHAGFSDVGPFDASDLGLPPVWRRVGPLSPYPRLDLERVEPHDDERVLPEDARTLVQNRSVVRDYEASGTSEYETWVRVYGTRDRLLVFESDYGAVVRWNDEVVVRRPATGRYRRRSFVRALQLAPGWHRVRVRIGSGYAASEFRVRLVPLTVGEEGVTFAATPENRVGLATHRLLDPGETTPMALLRRQGGPTTRALQAYAALLTAQHLADEDLAERALAQLDVSLESPSAEVSPLIAMAAADVVRSAYSRPSTQRENLRTQWLRAAYESSSGAGAVALELAATVDDELEAGAILAELEEPLGFEPEIAFALHRHYANQGFRALSEMWLVRALDAEPTWCRAVDDYAELLAQRDFAPDPDTLPSGFSECEDGVRYHIDAELLPEGRFDEAVAALVALARRYPSHGYYTRRASALLWRLERYDEAEELLTSYATHAGDDSAALLRADFEAGRGNTDAALAVLDEALAGERAGDHRLAEVAALLRAEPIWEDLRRDGPTEVANYLARDDRPVAPVVYAFDYGAHRYFENGRGISLTHQILQVQSREALGELGEVDVPSGAFLLRARTIKADGRTLEATFIPGKSSISVPGLEVGDFVEYEYVEALDPERGRGQSVVGGRFFFQVHDAPLVHSELLVEVPSSWDELTLDLRGGAPEPERTSTEHGERYRFLVTDSLPPVRENAAPPATEWLPSVRIAHQRTWSDVADTFRDRAADTVRVTPAIRALAEELTAGTETERAAAERLFRYVVDEIEELGGFFASDAMWTLRSGAGERLPLLLALFEAEGIAADVVFARGWNGDMVDGPIPDAQAYPGTALRVWLDGESAWLDPNLDNAPFDYVSSSVQGTEALVIVSADASQPVSPVTIPTWPAETRLQRTEIAMTLDDNGDVEGTILEVVPVENAASVRTLLERIPDERVLIQALEGALGSSVPGVTITDFEAVDAGDPNLPIELRYAFSAAGFARVEGNRLSIDAHILDRNLRSSLAAEPTRVHPLVLPSPFEEEVEIAIELPPGFAFETTPDPVSLEGTWVQYERSVDQTAAGSTDEGARLLMTRYTRVPVARVPPGDYVGLVDSLRSIERAEALHIEALR